MTVVSGFSRTVVTVRSARYTPVMTARSFAAVFLFALVAASISVVSAESAAGIRWTAPPQWKTEAARPMRAATYSITPAAGDRGVAECVVNYFGPGQGGSIEANVERWKGQVLGADGKPAAAKVSSRNVRGVRITVVDSSGSNKGNGVLGVKPADLFAVSVINSKDAAVNLMRMFFFLDGTDDF